MLEAMGNDYIVTGSEADPLAAKGRFDRALVDFELRVTRDSIDLIDALRIGWPGAGDGGTRLGDAGTSGKARRHDIGQALSGSVLDRWIANLAH